MPVEFSEDNDITVVTVVVPGGVSADVINVVEPTAPPVITMGVLGMQGVPGPQGPEGPPGPGGGVTDHGDLSGLSDDDHPQYHNNTRGDARYALLTHSHTVADITATGTADDTTYLRGDGTWAEPAGAGGGVTDHGSLTGLADDDHTQYYNQTRGDARYSLLAHTHVSTSISDSTATGRAVLTATDATAARTAIGAGTSNLALGSTGTTAAAGNHTHVATGITDSTTVGRSVLTAVDAAAARTAIGAGTSSLVIGTTSTTAKAGNYQPTAANISDSTTVGRSVLTAADATAARTAIGAGSSNLNLGTTSTTAAPGDHVHAANTITDLNETVMDYLGTGGLAQGDNVSLSYNDSTGVVTITAADPGLQAVNYADLPSGSMVTVYKHPTNGWPLRPTSRADIHVIWKGADPSPAIVTSGVNGMHDDSNGYGDTRFVLT